MKSTTPWPCEKPTDAAERAFHREAKDINVPDDLDDQPRTSFLERSCCMAPVLAPGS